MLSDTLSSVWACAPSSISPTVAMLTVLVACTLRLFGMHLWSDLRASSSRFNSISYSLIVLTSHLHVLMIDLEWPKLTAYNQESTDHFFNHIMIPSLCTKFNR